MNKNQFTDSLENALIWLSASDPEVLKNKCPRWEKIKYEAFGASVLVPVFFGMIASSYAVSTLTSNLFFIGMFALVWGFIILTIDRVLLSTYRAFVSKSKKWIQFTLRITVAILMGLTVSHPLTLLVFKDTIASEIEKERINEMMEMRQKNEGGKKALEERIRVVSAELAGHQKKYQDTVSGEFLTAAPAKPLVTATPMENSQFDDIDNQIREYKLEREEVRRDLEQWQTVYDEEVRGIRSGKSGIGPNARAIERDHLAWRRDEIRRLNGVISELAARRTKLSSELMAQRMEVNAQLQANRRDLEKQKLEVFASQQGNLLEVIKGQIDSTTAELAMLRKEAGQLSTDTSDRVAQLKEEKRSDLMAQTHTLHKIFKNPGGGGTFALAVYIVLVGLFTLIDTIPLVVKFCSVPGLYDKHLYYKENSVRAIGADEVIDDNFSDAMKKRDAILHGLLNYDPDKQVVTAELAQLPAPVVEEEAENFVDIDDKQITALEGGIFPPSAEQVVTQRHFVPREANGKVNTAVALGEHPKINGNSHGENVSPDGPNGHDVDTPIANQIELPAVVEEQIPAVASEESFIAEEELIVETPELGEIGAIVFNEPAKVIETPVVAEAPVQDLSEVYKDEPSMLEPGFGAVLLNGESDTADFSAQIEIPVRNQSNTKTTFKNNRVTQKAAGGLALQPTNLSDKAR